MSQQGGRPTGHEDDWWGQLYDDAKGDTGPTRAPDSLDDRFASAADTLNDVPGTARPPGAGAGDTDSSGRRPDGGVPAPRSGGYGAGARAGDPEPPSDAPPPPAPFPPGPKPPGFDEHTSEEAPPPPSGSPGPGVSAPPPGSPAPAASASPSGGRTSAETPSATSDWWAAPRAAASEPVPAPPGGAPRTGPGFTQPNAPVEPPDASGRSRPGLGSTPGPDSAPGTPEPPAPAKPDGGIGPGSTRFDAPVQIPGRTGPGSTQPNRPVPPVEPHEPAVSAVPVDPAPADPPDAPPAPDRHQDERPGAAEPIGRAPQATRTATRLDLPTVGFVGSGPPTYDAEPTALPPADPDELDDLVADTVLDGARYGACTLRAVSVRGDSARYRGEPRRDSLLTARFGTGDHALILVAMATGARATAGAHRAAAEACHWIGRAVGRSHARLAEDLRAARRGDLKSGLHRLTDRSLGKLRASASEQGVDPEEYAATLRCLLLPADPECRTRVFFGVGAGGLFRLRDGEWHDIEPRLTDTTGEPVVGFGSLPAETPEGDRLTMDLGIPTPPSPYEPAPEPPREPFRFRASVARPGDTLLMCTGGLAEPLRGEPDLCEYLTGRWHGAAPPGLAAFLADTQVRVKGYADDRTAAAVWEA
ncbi:protein phosphatase 2C domain-containing protein [Streptomyces sp. NPDC047072]|uniref:protein phosphatase 2C domain-containing protein n=1 Tax=Streptomyces sp. NPDC047072 TaxID=3154809 RepID=UPI0033DFEAEC